MGFFSFLQQRGTETPQTEKKGLSSAIPAHTHTKLRTNQGWNNTLWRNRRKDVTHLLTPSPSSVLPWSPQRSTSSVRDEIWRKNQWILPPTEVHQCGSLYLCIQGTNSYEYVQNRLWILLLPTLRTSSHKLNIMHIASVQFPFCLGQLEPPLCLSQLPAFWEEQNKEDKKEHNHFPNTSLIRAHPAALLALLGLNIIHARALLSGRGFGFLTLRFCWLPIMGDQRSHAVLLGTGSHEFYVISEWLMIFGKLMYKLPCKLQLLHHFHPTVKYSIASCKIHVLLYRTCLCSWETSVTQSLLKEPLYYDSCKRCYTTWSDLPHQGCSLVLQQARAWVHHLLCRIPHK